MASERAYAQGENTNVLGSGPRGSAYARTRYEAFKKVRGDYGADSVCWVAGVVGRERDMTGWHQGPRGRSDFGWQQQDWCPACGTRRTEVMIAPSGDLYCPECAEVGPMNSDPNVVLIYAVDPGGTTGTAFGRFRIKEGRTVGAHVRAADRRGYLSSAEFSGEPMDQVRLIYRDILDKLFLEQVDGDYPVRAGRLFVVIEKFQLRGNRALSGEEVLRPVEIGWALRSRLDVPDVEIVWQTPSDALGFATKERLRRWGLWDVGSEHTRDAWAHVARQIHRLK